ncbi:origin recognition complex subunit 3 N-terminus-domain-containing protein [Gloeopeniophorella convolvens]|nr:origin recognition complex subunit 3 N-terminus-domain-containing protein [Gloeopeniophorella convolvens]
MLSPPDLDDISQGYPPFEERDLPDGYATRLDLYRAAWKKCFERIENIVNSLHAPLIEEIIRGVHRAYDDVLPGLPYPELPVLAILGSSSSPSFVSNIANRLESDELDESEDDDPPSRSYVIHIQPSDCNTIMSAMKAIVTGFVDHPPDGQDVKRKVTTSLANYDIELLRVWYGVLRDASEGPEPPPQLVVFLHDFEQFDESVMQDVFYICSSHVPHLPLIFVLALSSPHPSFIHSTYPQSTLSLLRVDTFTIPSGTALLENVLSKTFFDLQFESDVMIGPAALDFLRDFFCRNSSSLDGTLLILQVAHMKHFDEPLTVFVRDELLGTSFAFLSSLLSWSLDPQNVGSNGDSWPISAPAGLLDSVAGAREEFRSRLRRSKFAFGIMRRVQSVMLGFGYRSAEANKTPLEMMSACLKGELGREGRYLGTMTRKLPDEKCQTLLRELEAYLQELPDQLDEVREAQQRVTGVIRLAEGSQIRDPALIASELGDWLTGYFQDHIVNLEDSRLWEIWYTGSTPFPSEMINPSPRATVLSALLQPHTFLPPSEGDVTPQRLPIWKLPDTSILFRRYLEAGRMINVYDWYESFSQVIESQRSHLGPEEVENGAQDEEEWKMHVQARFVRALHTLDLLGFIKHTGRKADHVMRTVFDMPE